jgi:hypothetical protein
VINRVLLDLVIKNFIITSNAKLEPRGKLEKLGKEKPVVTATIRYAASYNSLIRQLCSLKHHFLTNNPCMKVYRFEHTYYADVVPPLEQKEVVVDLQSKSNRCPIQLIPLFNLLYLPHVLLDTYFAELMCNSQFNLQAHFFPSFIKT